MRTIKFRGTTTKNKTVYGFLVQLRGQTTFKILDKTMDLWRVRTDTIAQLVGYDCDGREVYEGDILVDELEQEYIAEIYDRPEKIARLKIKEATS